MQPIQELYPVVPKYIKKYISDYYSNTTSTFVFDGEVIEEQSYYFEVVPTPEQALDIKNKFQNKSEYPYEIFLDNYMLNVLIEYDKTTKQFNKRCFLVVFLIGKIFPGEQIDFPNILSNDYLTATYYEISDLEFDQIAHVTSVLPVRLANDNIINFDPKNVVMAENNLIFPNSERYIKVRTGNVIFSDSYPENSPQPVSISYIKDDNTNLISSGGIALYNINYLSQSWYITGLSQSIVSFIDKLN